MGAWPSDCGAFPLHGSECERFSVEFPLAAISAPSSGFVRRRSFAVAEFCRGPEKDKTSFFYDPWHLGFYPSCSCCFCDGNRSRGWTLRITNHPNHVGSCGGVDGDRFVAGWFSSPPTMDAGRCHIHRVACYLHLYSDELRSAEVPVQSGSFVAGPAGFAAPLFEYLSAAGNCLS